MSERPFIQLLQTPLYKYAYDVNTNQIIRLSDELYEYFEKFSSKEPSEKIKNQIDNLKSRGYLSSNHIKKIRHQETDRLKFHLDSNIAQITLQVTQQCNFRCSYCPYTTSEFDNQREHGSKVMSVELAKKAVDFYLNHSINQESAVIGFYGGEPLLIFNLMKEVVEYAEKRFAGKEILFTVTTNGSLFTKEILDFLIEHDFTIMVSLDGPPDIHNRSRKFAASGKGTFETIEKNFLYIKDNYLELLKKMLVNVVVDPRYSADGIHKLFSDNELFNKMNIQTTIIDDFFCIEKVVPDERYLIDENIYRFKALASYIRRYPKEKVSNVALSDIERMMSEYDSIKKNENGLNPEMAPGGPCIPGQKRLFIDVNGNLFPCERVSETSEAMKIGTIDQGFNYEKAEKLLNVGQLTEEKCKNCFAVLQCSVCGRVCDNNGVLSAELKSSNCKDVRARVIDNFKDYLFKKEFNIKITDSE